MTQPDVVLLSVDSLRYDAVFDGEGEVRDGLAGFERLVDYGVSYDDAWATASYTVGSVRSILSGSYQWSYDGDPYEADRPHVAEYFSELGYATGGFHSNPLLHEKHGWNRGFDHYFTGGFEGTGKSVMGAVQNLVTKFDVTSQLAQSVLSLVGQHTGRDIRGGGRPYIPADELQRRAVEWADEQHNPVFTWVHYMDVHNPWYPHEGTDSADLDKSNLMRSFYKARDNPSSVTDADRRTLQKAYRGSVQNFDRHLDSFLDELERTLDDPILCLTSDHGELFGENETYLHPASVYSKLLHVPLIVGSSGESPSEQAPVSTVDVLPTLVSMANGDVSGATADASGATADVDGRDLSADEAADRLEVFGASSDEVRVVTEDGDSAYDVAERDFASELSDSGREQVERLRSSDLTGRRTIDDDDDELDEQLEALGYK
jgi:arylsulfatase A-like enzyme